MAINSLKSRNWTDNQWYNFICGLIKEPSIVGPGPEPPTPFIDLGIGYAYIVPPDMVLESVRVTQPNEVYIEVHLYEENVQAANYQVKSYILRLDTCTLEECEQIDPDYRWLSAFKRHKYVSGSSYNIYDIASFARLLKQTLDVNIVDSVIAGNTSGLDKKSTTDLTTTRAVAVLYGSYHGCLKWFGVGRTLFFRWMDYPYAYTVGDDGEISEGISGYAVASGDYSSSGGAVSLVMKAMHNGALTYINFISLGISVNSRFVVWVQNLSDLESYGYEFVNPKLRFSMTVPGFVYLSGTFTHRVFNVDCVVSIDSESNVNYFDNPATGDSVVVCSEKLDIWDSVPYDITTYMSKYSAHFAEPCEDDIALFGPNETFDIAEDNQFNIVFIALPGSMLTDNDHIMIITWELDGFYTYLYSVSSGSITQYGTNPNTPEVLPYNWSNASGYVRLGVTYGNVCPSPSGFICYEYYSSSKRPTVALAEVTQAGVNIRASRQLASIETPKGVASFSQGNWNLVVVSGGSGSTNVFEVFRQSALGSFISISTLEIKTSTIPLIGDRTETQISYEPDAITECGDDRIVLWHGQNGYIFSNVSYSYSSDTWSGVFTGYKFVIEELGVTTLFNGTCSRTTVYNNGGYLCVYKLRSGCGSKIIRAEATQEVIVIENR